MVTLRRTWRLFWSWTLVWATVVVAAADGATPPAAVAAGVAVAACCLPWPLLRVPFPVAAGVAGAVALGVAVVPMPAGVVGTGAAVVALLVVAGLVALRVPAGPAVWLVALVGLAAVFTAARWGVPVAGGVAVLLAGVLAGVVDRRVRAQRARRAAVAEQLAAIVAEVREAEGDVTEALDRIEDAGRRALAILGRPVEVVGSSRSARDQRTVGGGPDRGTARPGARPAA